jgi:hypothetical protein
LRLREARLIATPPEQVFAELERYGEGSKGSWFDSDENLEKVLLARGERLIDLGLARYACDDRVVTALYEKSRCEPADHLEERFLRGLRIACLSNEANRGPAFQFPEHLIGRSELARLVRDAGEDELAVLFSNPRLDDCIIEALYRSEGVFASLPDERRRLLVELSADNPRVTAERGFKGMPDLGYCRFHKAILAMLASVPMTPQWLHALGVLLERMDPGEHGLADPEQPIAPILERWAEAAVPSDERRDYYTGLCKTDAFRCLLAALYGMHYPRYLHGGEDRFNSRILGSADSPDVVLRCAYYGRAWRPTEQEMRDGFARDKGAYLLAILRNDSVLREPSRRRLLETEQLRGPFADLYTQRCQHIRTRHPEFDPRPVPESWSNGEGSKSEASVALAPPPDRATDNHVVRLDGLETRVTRIARLAESAHVWTWFGILALGALMLIRGH